SSSEGWWPRWKPLITVGLPALLCVATLLGCPRAGRVPTFTGLRTPSRPAASPSPTRWRVSVAAPSAVRITSEAWSRWLTSAPSTAPTPPPTTTTTAPVSVPAPSPTPPASSWGDYAADALSTNTVDWACIRTWESGDNYSDFAGAYGFEGANYSSMPPSQQDAYALVIFQRNGDHFSGAWNDKCTE